MLKEETRIEVQKKLEQEIADHKEEQKELTLDEFINKSFDCLENRKDVEYLPVKGFGKIPFNRPTDNELLKYLNAASKGATLDEEGKAKMIDMTPIAIASKTLVYQSCTYLHDKRLLEKSGVEEPFDIAFKLFGISETIDLAGKISDKFGSNEVSKKIKN